MIRKHSHLILGTFLVLEFILSCGSSATIALEPRAAAELLTTTNSSKPITNDTVTANNWPKDKVTVGPAVPNGTPSTLTKQSTSTIIHGEMIIPDRGIDPNYDKSKISHHQDSASDSDSEDNHMQNSSYPAGQPKFDEKAAQRALIVIGGIVAIILIYMGIKFSLVKKKKVDKRYGRIESEIDLLDEIEEQGESEEEDDTLFDIKSTQHRSQF